MRFAPTATRDDKEETSRIPSYAPNMYHIKGHCAAVLEDGRLFPNKSPNFMPGTSYHSENLQAFISSARDNSKLKALLQLL